MTVGMSYKFTPFFRAYKYGCKMSCENNTNGESYQEWNLGDVVSVQLSWRRTQPPHMSQVLKLASYLSTSVPSFMPEMFNDLKWWELMKSCPLPILYCLWHEVHF